jgi:hypothetical protein
VPYWLAMTNGRRARKVVLKEGGVIKSDALRHSQV